MIKLRSILLVDDDDTTNYLNRKLLQRLAVADDVLVALDGEEALRVLENECADGGPTCPALIFLDINMPGMNGFEFLEAYQRLPLSQREAIVIVMLTTSVHPQDLDRLEALPVRAFLNKPLDSAKVQGILEAYFPEA